MSGIENPVVAPKGLEGVVAANTRLSDVQGENGKLIYCGYDIDELAGKASFEEVVHLLHRNHLPNQKEIKEFKERLPPGPVIPAGVPQIITAPPQDPPPPPPTPPPRPQQL